MRALPSEFLLHASNPWRVLAISMQRFLLATFIIVFAPFLWPQSNQQPTAGQTAAAPGSTPATPLPDTSSPPAQPRTEILDSSATGGALTTDGHDPVLDPPPLPEGITTLAGGVITGVDRVRNHMTIKVFGGGKWTVAFDERTHIFRNGAETTWAALKKGERVYVDTMLDSDHHNILARNIRVGVPELPADADGQVVDVDARRGTVDLRDRINASTVHFAIDKDTRIVQGGHAGGLQDVQQGSLVHVSFSPRSANRGLAREIAIIATPGSAFTFLGKVTYLDMHRGLLAIQNATDERNYEIHFVSSQIADARKLAVGMQVKIVALFEATQYRAQAVTLTQTASEPEEK
jgi:hypothetical protein